MRAALAPLVVSLALALSPSVAFADDDGKDDGRGESSLARIVDLMKEVESRLNEADAGTLTQDDQRRIVEAMKLQGKAKTALDDLIEKLEATKKFGASKPDASAHEPTKEASKEDTATERRLRSLDPAGKKPRSGAKDARSPDDATARRSGAKPPETARGSTDRSSDAGRWGDLRAKLHEDAQKARKTPVPERWRESIERYRQATAD